MPTKEAMLRSLRFGPLAPVYEWYALRKWERSGRPVPPPYTVKRRMILEFARRFGCRVLVETGTYRGDTPWTLRHEFDRLYSIELFEPLYRAAYGASRGCRTSRWCMETAGRSWQKWPPAWTGAHCSGSTGTIAGRGPGWASRRRPSCAR